jgi:hypothetical protein
LAALAGDTVVISFNSAADTLAEGAHSNTITFMNLTSGGGGISRSVHLTVNPKPPVLLASCSESGSFQLLLNGEPLQTYGIEATTDLDGWNSIVTNSTSADGTVIYEEPEFSQIPFRFYRARALPKPVPTVFVHPSPPAR